MTKIVILFFIYFILKCQIILGLYGYRADFLKQFADFKRTKLKSLECGVEMLRVMERGYKIKLVETKYNTIGVDLPEHIAIIEKILKSKI